MRQQGEKQHTHSLVPVLRGPSAKSERLERRDARAISPLKQWSTEEGGLVKAKGSAAQVQHGPARRIVCLGAGLRGVAWGCMFLYYF